MKPTQPSLEEIIREVPSFWTLSLVIVSLLLRVLLKFPAIPDRMYWFEVMKVCDNERRRRRRKETYPN